MKFGKFSKIVIKYVLGTLVIIAFAIIYLYIGKIIILRDIPSNEIFRILATLFIIGLPIWTMSKSFENNEMIDKINRKLPILFIPFIFLQIYSIGVRIANNGFTEARYICVMLIIFEIIYIAIYMKNSKNVSKILWVFVTLLIISVLIPFINMFKVSEFSQYNNLKIYKEKTEYTEEEKEKISGAYRYLRYSESGYKYIEKLLNEEDIERIKKFDNRYSYYYDYSEAKENTKTYLSGSASINSIDISGYNTLYCVSYNSNYSAQHKNEAFKYLQFIIRYEGRTVNLDLTEAFNNYINNYYTYEYFENNNEIVIDDLRKIIITSYSMRYDQATGEVDNCTISGYLLEK